MSEQGRRPVVVGVDGSGQSVAALSWAARYAAAVGAPIRVVMAWHYPPITGTAPVGVAPEQITGELLENMRAEVDAAVVKVFPDQQARSAAGVETEISYGHPAQVLIEESRNADLLVVGNRGHGAFAGMLLGSVSMQCVTHAACPVTVVRDAHD